MTPQAERAERESWKGLGHDPADAPAVIEKAQRIAYPESHKIPADTNTLPSPITARKRRADAGIPRPKTSTAPAPLGAISAEQKAELERLIEVRLVADRDTQWAQKRYNEASMALELFIESLVKP